MRYYEWAIRNPKETRGYQDLLAHLKKIEMSVVTCQSQIEDATIGKSPKHDYFMLTGVTIPTSLLSDIVLPIVDGDYHYSWGDTSLIQETRDLAMRRINEHRAKLEGGVEERQKKAEEDRKRGEISSLEFRLSRLGEEKRSVEKKLQEYQPDLTDWRTFHAYNDHGGDDIRLKYAVALADRMYRLLDVYHMDDILENIDRFIGMYGEYQIEVSMRIKSMAVVTIKSNCASFTRWDFQPEYALYRALLTFLDHQWGNLIGDLGVGIP